MYYNKNTSYPQGRWCLGRALGPTKNVGNKMCQWILKTNGEIVARRTVCHLNAGEEANPAFEAEKSEMMTYIYQRYGSPFCHKNVQPRKQQHNDFVLYEPVYDDEGFIPSEMPKDAEFNGEYHLPIDAFVNMEVLMSQGGEERVARVVGRAVDENGELIGQHNDNPVLNTLLYEVEFPDGQCQTYAANLIAEAVQRHCDINGNRWSFIRGIVDHRISDEALGPGSRYTTRAGLKRRHKTTKGVELQCELEDGSTQWFLLKELKESDPVTVALYANKMGLTKLPAFFWWVPHTLKKKKHIEKAIIARVHATKFKFGIEVP